MKNEKKRDSALTELPLCSSSCTEILNHEVSKKTTTTQKDNRSRIWTFLCYPDSIPTDWEEKLSTLQWIRSPLHDRDIQPDGSIKKAHWHMLLAFPGKKSYNQILEITKSLNATIPQNVKNQKGLVRYFLHLDDPQKAQYKKSDIVSHGLNPDDFLVTQTDKKLLVREIVEYIRVNEITEMKDLAFYALSEKPEWFDLMSSGYTMFLNSIISSFRHSKKEQKADISSIIKQL